LVLHRSILICDFTYTCLGGIPRKSRCLIGQNPNKERKGSFEVHIGRHRVLNQVNVTMPLPIDHPRSTPSGKVWPPKVPFYTPKPISSDECSMPPYRWVSPLVGSRYY
ncbi:hypothetical protein PspLS_09190, partial [Pyricularia sp. CBS 133598]